ncbi:hypothetical protein KY310_04570 [Candidatus Woesearchaeota archaeon]|nr:hypothetical protein [Candidatus Woesearchaeota archaeon]
MTDKPLEEILNDFRQFLEEPAEVNEISRILGNYQNRSLSGNEHEQLRQLYFALKPRTRNKYHTELKAKFVERAELDLNHMESVQAEAEQKISVSRYENTLAALKSYSILADKLKFPDSLKLRIEYLSILYEKGARFSSDNKYVHLYFDQKYSYLEKAKKSLKQKRSFFRIKKKTHSRKDDISLVETQSSLANIVRSASKGGTSAAQAVGRFGVTLLGNAASLVNYYASSFVQSKTASYLAAGAAFLSGLAGMMTGSAYICENSELFGTSCAIGTITGELIYSLVGAGLGYIGFDKSKPLTVASGLGLGALSTLGSVGGTKIAEHLLRTPLEGYPAELDWISGISGGVVGTPALAFAVFVGLATLFGDSK